MFFLVCCLRLLINVSNIKLFFVFILDWIMIKYLQITTTAAATTTTQQQQQQQPQQQATMILKAVKPLHLMRPRGCSGHISSGLCLQCICRKAASTLCCNGCFLFISGTRYFKKKKIFFMSSTFTLFLVELQNLGTHCLWESPCPGRKLKALINGWCHWHRWPLAVV